MDDYLRSSSTITDLEFCQAVAEIREPLPQDDGYYYVHINDVAESFDIHPNRVRSKLKRLWKRSIADGCPCGCRGDITLLPKGEELLLKGETDER